MHSRPSGSETAAIKTSSVWVLSLFSGDWDFSLGLAAPGAWPRSLCKCKALPPWTGQVGSSTWIGRVLHQPVALVGLRKSFPGHSLPGCLTQAMREPPCRQVSPLAGFVSCRDSVGTSDIRVAPEIWGWEGSTAGQQVCGAEKASCMEYTGPWLWLHCFAPTSD